MGVGAGARLNRTLPQVVPPNQYATVTCRNSITHTITCRAVCPGQVLTVKNSIIIVNELI